MLGEYGEVTIPVKSYQSYGKLDHAVWRLTNSPLSLEKNGFRSDDTLPITQKI
jgi:hypothetical protein